MPYKHYRSVTRCLSNHPRHGHRRPPPDAPSDAPTDTKPDTPALDAPTDSPIDTLPDAIEDAPRDTPDAPCLIRPAGTLAPCTSESDCYACRYVSPGECCDTSETDGLIAHCWPVEGPITSTDFGKNICHWYFSEPSITDSQGCADLRESPIDCTTVDNCPPIGCSPPFNNPDSVIVECASLQCTYRWPF